MFLIIKAILLAYARLPEAVFPFFANFNAHLMSKVAKKNNKLASGNIFTVYGIPPHSIFSKQFIAQNYRSQLTLLYETVRHIFLKRKTTILNISALKKHILSASDNNCGCIIVSAHIGSWEFVAEMMSRCADEVFQEKGATGSNKQKVEVLAKKNRWQGLNTFIEQLRGQYGASVLWNHKTNLGRSMVKSLQNGNILGMVVDQKPLGRLGPQVNFFNQKTAFVGGPARLAIKYQIPIHAVFCLRIGAFKYKLYTETIFDPKNPPEKATEDELTQRIATSIEKIISIYPEQWIWNYKRWRQSSMPSQKVV